MASQTEQQRITIHLLHNISRRKDDQAIKIGQLIKHSVIFLFKNYAQNEVGILVPDLFLFFKKVLYNAKGSSQHLSCNIGW